MAFAQQAGPQADPQSLLMLGDAELEAEIAMLDEADEDDVKPTPVGFEVVVEPLYETALSVQTETIVADELENFDAYVEISIDDSLSQLRAALAELNSAFGSADRDERLAS